jgi:signal transduction histidine kinase
LERSLGASELITAQQNAAEITQALHDTSARVRDAIFDLRTAPEPGESIGAWARCYVKEFSEVHNLQGEVDEIGAEVALPLPHALRVMAMIREGLHNVAKHAHARSVTARLSWGKGNLIVVVADDGRGLPDPVPGPEKGRYGLTVLRQYAESHGGALTVTSRCEGGTELTFALPCGGTKIA